MIERVFLISIIIQDRDVFECGLKKKPFDDHERNPEGSKEKWCLEIAATHILKRILQHDA
jgi:hypothetical protein